MDEQIKYQRYLEYASLITKIASWQLDKIEKWNPKEYPHDRYILETRKRLTGWQNEAESELRQICEELEIQMPDI